MLNHEQQVKAALLLNRFKEALWNRPAFSALVVEADELLSEAEFQELTPLVPMPTDIFAD